MTDIMIIVSSIITAVASGGWFVNYKLKKKAEKASINSDNVDLTDKILKKYQETVLGAMNANTSQYDALASEIRHVSRKVSDISEFLNGEFHEFQIKKKNEKCKK